ncbi:sugar ABC transporter ATP-binding protein [Devosia sp. WQ 349]|uniref:sugar ABC transporter ATP-binding protein n=1 Tax=Devosia sp. WQ 349K1 TaxID=2800329 RepID=UPI00190563CE|nr:sugar ABC transporter ATP-binding protein [Devosia sp. WQ 349K1]MBK1792958.1 sugar ABC transporter ATP-binding protein [Devosia sp. WQ 349K1]
MVLSIEGATKAFPGVKALDSVSLDLRPGEIHALMGENGAGKSTLIKIITGVHRPDSGRVLLNGKPIELHAPRDAIAHGISAVHQERNLIPRFSVAENIVLEHLPRKNGLVDYAAAHAEARKYLDRIGLPIDTHTQVRNLSVAQMQIVEIAKALRHEAQVLLLDEPTASISETEADALFALLRQLRDRGVAIVFVSHKLEEVFAICDRVTVLRDGKIAASGEPMSEMTRGKLVSLMIGREEKETDYKNRNLPENTPTKLLLQFISTSLGHKDVTLYVKKGEIVGLYGLVGAGRSELARALIGDAKITKGVVKIDGKPVRISSVEEALTRHRIGYLSEDRKSEGLILSHPIRSNIAVTIWRRLANALGFLHAGAETAAAKPLAARLEIRTPSLEQLVGNLSGGNQQKVQLAKWLAAEVDILIIDEPTVGIDIKTKAYIHELIVELADSGMTIIVISSDMPEMIALADHIVVMKDFAIAGQYKNDHVYKNMSNQIIAAIHNSETSPEEVLA